MAGAGYKQFADGDVLTAAQVQTFLQDQAVMRFADSSARTTALGTAVAEGMLSYLDDTNEVQVYDGSSWAAVGLPLGTATPTDGQILTFGTATSTWNPTDQLAGIGSNVVQTVKTDTFSTTSTSFAAITGLTAAITPSSATSKILVIAQISGSGTHFLARLSGGNAGTYVGDAAGSRVRTATFINGPSGLANSTTIVFLDSPATASAVTYGVEIRRGGVTSETLVVNGNQDTADNTNRGRMASSITAIEVAA